MTETAVSPTDPDPDNGDGKADGSRPLASGTLLWNVPMIAGVDAALPYVTFELSGPADITIATTPLGDSDDGLDTALFLYRPSNGHFGRNIGKAENGGIGEHAQLTASLPAGTYRALVVRRGGDPKLTTIAGTCSGAGCTPPPHNCAPLDARTAAPDVFVGPTGWQDGIFAAIDSATTSLDVQMYLFTVTAIADRIAAAHDRGVAVRVLTDPNEPNGTALARLPASIPRRTDPAQFSFAHAKYMLIDNTRLVIMSGNFNAGAVKDERNYAIVDRDLDDVDDVRAIFASDWTNGPAPDLGCTRLLVSPVNSGPRILDHINSAQKTLDIEVLYLNDTGVRDAVVAAANVRHVAVRVMLSDPAKNTQNTAMQTYLDAHGVTTKILLANYLHTKMIMADGVALVGSENMSSTSFTKNREVGALVSEPSAASVIQAQYELDWAAAQ